MKPVTIDRRARAELREAMRWYENQRQGLGRELQVEVEEVIDRVAENPSGYPRYQETDIQFALLQRFPYVIYFAELERSIWIAAIAHERRRLGYWMGRVPPRHNGD
jgi:toxin ParE1/3/4